MDILYSVFDHDKETCFDQQFDNWWQFWYFWQFSNCYFFNLLEFLKVFECLFKILIFFTFFLTILAIWTFIWKFCQFRMFWNFRMFEKFRKFVLIFCWTFLQSFTISIIFTIAKTILENCDIWDVDNNDNWEPMTIYVTWQLSVTLRCLWEYTLLHCNAQEECSHQIHNAIWLCWLSCSDEYALEGGTQFKDPNCLGHQLKLGERKIQLKYKNVKGCENNRLLCLAS